MREDAITKPLSMSLPCAGCAHPRPMKHPNPKQGSDTRLYGVWCPDLDAGCCHPHAETGRCAAAMLLVGSEEDQQQATSVTLLEHDWDVLVLVVYHKAQVQGVFYLTPLRLLPHISHRCTKAVASSNGRVMVSNSRSSQHQHTNTAQLWSMFTVATLNIQNMSTQQVKLGAHVARTYPHCCCRTETQSRVWLCV